MVLRKILVGLGLLTAIGAPMNAGSVVTDVIGDKAPHFVGHMVDDGVYAWKGVKQEICESSKEFIEGCKKFDKWLLEELKTNGKVLLRVLYQTSKVTLGACACGTPLPNSMVGIGYGENASTSNSKQIIKHVPTRVVGLGLIWHGLKGLMRECGFSSFSELYHFVENDVQVDEPSEDF